MTTLIPKFEQPGTGAVNRPINLKLQETISVADYGATGDGTTDDTAAVNAAILAAYKAKASYLSLTPSDEVYSVEVIFDGGLTYKIVGPILLPSGIRLNGNGCRLIGTYTSAQTTAYSDSETSIIETAFFNGTTIVTNRSAALATNRVIGSSIENFSFLFANCAINAINMNENCYIRHCSYSSVSAAIRLKSCFYLEVSQQVIRTSSQAASQASIQLYGTSNNNITFTHVACVGPSIGISIAENANFTIDIDSCSFEEGKADDSIGISLIAGAYCAGLNISSSYFEGVKYGMYINDTGAIYGSSINDNIFNNNEYAIYAVGASALRVTNIMGNSLPDDGGVNRNLIDISTSNNDVFVQIPSKLGSETLGISSFLTNVIPSNISTTIATSIWRNASTSALIAKSDPGLANQNDLNSFAFEGGQCVTTANNVPFCTYAFTTDTLTINTQIAFDESNILAFNLTGNYFVGSFNLKGFIFNTTVSYVTQTPGSAAITVNNNGGAVQLVVVLTGATPVSNVKGVIRHV